MTLLCLLEQSLFINVEHFFLYFWDFRICFLIICFLCLKGLLVCIQIICGPQELYKSNGKKKIFFSGHKVEGVWHTSIVVYEREYFFGAQGISSCPPVSNVLIGTLSPKALKKLRRMGYIYILLTIDRAVIPVKTKRIVGKFNSSKGRREET